jgi:hypothetical protein
MTADLLRVIYSLGDAAAILLTLPVRVLYGASLCGQEKVCWVKAIPTLRKRRKAQWQ